MHKNTRVLLADDHNVVRQGVSLILRESFKNIEVHHADTFDEVLINLDGGRFDILVLDINLPGGNSVSMIEKALAIQNDIRILIFSAYDEEQYAIRYIHAGAKGFLNKLSSEDKIIEAVQSILNGENYVSEKISEMMSENELNRAPINPLDALSNRELEIASLLAEGEGNLEISNKLNIQMSTVSTYKNRIFEKLGVSNLVSMVEKFKLYSDN